MFYATNLCIFCCRHFSHFLTFHFWTTSTTSKMLTMADLELTNPHSAAASNHKVSCYHRGQVGCCCWFRIVVCLHYFVVSCSVCSSLSLFCFVASNLLFLSFINSISCCFLVVAYSICIGSPPWILLPILAGIGLGGAPIPRRPRPPISWWPWPPIHQRPRQFSCSHPRRCSWFSSLAASTALLLTSLDVHSVLLIGLSSAALASAVLLIGIALVFLALTVLLISSSASVLRTKPLSLVLVLLLGSWCFGAASHETFGVLLLGKFF
jgi:hypothetical protein